MTVARYPNYKKSTVEWLPEIPAHWTIRRLKHECRVIPSNVDKKSKADETAVLLCNYTDVYYSDRIVKGMDFMPATATDEQVAKFSLRGGDTIITKDSETADDIAVAAYVPQDLPGVVCGYHLAVIRPFQREGAPFVKWLFGASQTRAAFEVRANGLTRVGLGTHDIENVVLAFPPLAEREIIARFLFNETAKIDALVLEQQRLVALLKEKLQAAISHAVTKGLDPTVPMKNSGIEWLGQMPAHWTLPPLYTRYEQALGKMLDQSKITGEWPMPYLRNVDVRWDRIDDQDLPVMDIRPEERDRFTVRKGDLLMVEGRELGRCAIWAGENNTVAFQKALHRLRPRDATESPRYFYYLMVFANAVGVFFADQLPNEIPHLTGEELRRYRLPKPPIGEQYAIAASLDAISAEFAAAVSTTERAIALLGERRSALISAAVTGQIDVRGFVSSKDVAA